MNDHLYHLSQRVPALRRCQCARHRCFCHRNRMPARHRQSCHRSRVSARGGLFHSGNNGSQEDPYKQRPRERRGASALQRPADGSGPHRAHPRCDEGDPENESRSAPRIRNCPHPGCSWARKRCDHDENHPADHSRTVKECVLHLARHDRQSRSRRKKRHACFAPRATRSCKPASQRQFSSG